MAYDPSAKSGYPVGYPVGSATVPTDISSPVRDRIGGCESWLSDLHGAVDQLEKRLDTILTPAPPQPSSTGGVAKNGQLQSHVQGRLELLQEGFSHLCSRIQQLQSRVEL